MKKKRGNKESKSGKQINKPGYKSFIMSLIKYSY